MLKDELAGSNLTDLINILDISVVRLEKFAYTAMRITELRTKQHQFKFSNIQLKLVINDTIKALTERCNQKRLQLSVDEIHDDFTIFGEFELLKLAFINILDNAIKYSKENGKIFIKIQHSNTKVSCQFIDQGKGFSKKALENLFEYFSSGEESMDETLGLDLALAKLIMDVHSGKIEAGNMESGGAVVTLTFYRNV
jgi:signal transduction histidine kinase